jgi:hypothetical protein
VKIIAQLLLAKDPVLPNSSRACCKSHSFNAGVFEEEGVGAVILAINAEKMLVARISQSNSNVLSEWA